MIRGYLGLGRRGLGSSSIGSRWPRGWDHRHRRGQGPKRRGKEFVSTETNSRDGTKDFTYHEVKANNQQNLERGKDEFHLTVHPNEEQVGNDQQATKEDNPCCGRRPIIPVRDDHSGGSQFGGQRDEVVVNRVPALCKREGGIDKVFGVTDDGARQWDQCTAGKRKSVRQAEFVLY